MSSKESRRIEAVEGTMVRIRSGGEVLDLDYHGAMTAHESSLWWGTAVGFRAMQAAAVALSADTLWSRDDLYVVSAHPGPGVIDAINYVCKVVDRGRFLCIREKDCGKGCNSSMKYEWWVSDGERTATIQLRAEFVPWSFYELSDRLGTPQQTKADVRAFEIFKVNLSSKIWNAPLAESFKATLTPRPLAVGELPEPAKAADYWDNLKTLRAAGGPPAG
jgi:hypothetical protein